MSFKTALKVFRMLTDKQLLEVQETTELNSCCWDALHVVMIERGLEEEIVIKESI